MRTSASRRSRGRSASGSPSSTARRTRTSSTRHRVAASSRSTPRTRGTCRRRSRRRAGASRRSHRTLRSRGARRSLMVLLVVQMPWVRRTTSERDRSLCRCPRSYREASRPPARAASSTTSRTRPGATSWEAPTRHQPGGPHRRPKSGSTPGRLPQGRAGPGTGGRGGRPSPKPRSCSTTARRRSPPSPRRWGTTPTLPSARASTTASALALRRVGTGAWRRADGPTPWPWRRWR
mmetsp:Transcript_8143/g.24166  ORF Transcript_8143/g.24166 Transcript_8143/m.24166 type:complete len:235 (-) Transcript_8143:1333-2037(-)